MSSSSLHKDSNQRFTIVDNFDRSHLSARCANSNHLTCSGFTSKKTHDSRTCVCKCHVLGDLE